MSLHHFAVPRLRHSLLFTSLLLVSSFSAHTADEMPRKVVGKRACEVAYSQQENALWVTTSQSHSLDKGGIVYCLDPTILDVTQTIRNDLRPFSVAISRTTGTLWFGNTVDSIVTVIDAKTGAAEGRLALDECQHSETVCPLQPRGLVASEQTNTVYITGLSRKSVIWVVDGVILKLKTTITGTGAVVMGLATDSRVKRLYITSADGELLTIDSESNTVVPRKKLQGDGKAHLYLNLSFDTAGRRISITDSKQSEVLMVDTHDGKALEKTATPESLAVLFNPTRNEAYVTHRKVGEVSVIDDKRYKIVKTLRTLTHPNGPALSNGGKALYVGVKQASSRGKEATAPDDIIRIALQNARGDDAWSGSRPARRLAPYPLLQTHTGLINQMAVYLALSRLAWAVVISGDRMRKPFMVICVGAVLVPLADCSSNHVMIIKGDQMIVTHGKPQLGKETGVTSYVDGFGNKRETNNSDMPQLVEDS